jgi:hypothetical protein
MRSGSWGPAPQVACLRPPLPLMLKITPAEATIEVYIPVDLILYGLIRSLGPASIWPLIDLKRARSSAVSAKAFRGG